MMLGKYVESSKSSVIIVIETPGLVDIYIYIFVISNG